MSSKFNHIYLWFNIYIFTLNNIFNFASSSKKSLQLRMIYIFNVRVILFYWCIGTTKVSLIQNQVSEIVADGNPHDKNRLKCLTVITVNYSKLLFL